MNETEKVFILDPDLSFTARRLKVNPDGQTLYGSHSGFKGFFKIIQDGSQYRMVAMPGSSGWTNDVQEEIDCRIWVGRND